jgi:hypothetical protein
VSRLPQVDVAMDHLGLPLFDWSVLVQSAVRLPWLKRVALALFKTTNEVASPTKDGQPSSPGSPPPGRCGWLRRGLRGMLHALRVDSVLLRLRLREYEMHAVYVLRCFVLAHERARSELLTTLTLHDAGIEHREVADDDRTFLLTTPCTRAPAEWPCDPCLAGGRGRPRVEARGRRGAPLPAALLGGAHCERGRRGA